MSLDTWMARSVDCLYATGRNLLVLAIAFDFACQRLDEQGVLGKGRENRQQVIARSRHTKGAPELDCIFIGQSPDIVPVTTWDGITSICLKISGI